MTTETTSLTAWLLERIAEDEALVREGLADPEVGGNLSGQFLGWVETYQNEMTLTIAANRVLAECEVKRRIVERVPAVIEHDAPFERKWEWCPKARTEPLGDLPWGPDAECECGADAENVKGGNWFLRVLAAVYADAPGFRAEWAL